jgi:type I restriction enzyme M protein
VATKRKKARSTEVDAYVFIENQLKTLGWDTRNPDKIPSGQVYTQSECLSHPEIQKGLGLERPENIVKINESTFWVIEAKRQHTHLQKAIDEAEEKYARKINQSRLIKVKFISGIAGNQVDSYLIKNKYLHGDTFTPISLNGVESSGLFSPEEIDRILREDNPNIVDVPINEKLFVAGADEINEELHLGAVNPHQRASVMAAVLLSMLDSTLPNIDSAPSVLIDEINARAKRILTIHGKPEFTDYIKISLPSTQDNHAKFKTAIVRTIQELLLLNIRSALNSGNDVLGRFYEVFIKYANWAQDLGIVLTPRHITQFIAEVMNVGLNDIVYDPTCGTGGFLVAVFDDVKKHSNESQVQKFKENNLFGIEQDAGIVSLAIVNMIFRGDGKNNIIEGNCFSKFLSPATKKGLSTAEYSSSQSNKPPVSKVLMNPPFALKRSDEKEYKFINYALKQMDDGGVLFSVLPYAIMIKKGNALTWRREQLLKKNTLLSVITFPYDLFYPISINTLGIFVKKGKPHPDEQNVLWIRALNDGLAKKKGVRLPSPKATNDFEKIKFNLKSFLMDTDTPIENIPMFQKACPINSSDKNLELVPEVYLDEKTPDVLEIENGMEQLIRESIAYLIRAGREDVFNDKNN